MEDVLQKLRSFPTPTDTASYERHETLALNYYSTIRKILRTSIDGTEKARRILELLDPSTQSLAYLLVLDIVNPRTASSKGHIGDLDYAGPGSMLYASALSLLQNFDPLQIKYAPTEWRSLLEYIASAAEDAKKPFLAIRPIRDSILRLDSTGATFAVAHVYLARLCLLAKAYKVACPVLDRTIFAIPSKTDRLLEIDESAGNKASSLFEPPMTVTYVEYLQYFLYGGMIYMALEEWSKAHHFLGIVISFPVVNAVSLIMVEAYKKWLLVNLIDKGTVEILPKITSPLAAKTYKALARPYDALATAFVSGKWETLNDEAQFGQEIWKKDKNSGLVQQVLLAFRKKAVRSLGSTFAAVTTTDVSRRALSSSMDVGETERFMVSLAVQEGFSASLIHPSKDPNTSMLRFLDDQSAMTVGLETALQEQLQSHHQKLESLIDNIRASDRKLEFSKGYINHLRKTQKRNDPLSKDTSGITGRMRDQHFDLDEDMMDELQ